MAMTEQAWKAQLTKNDGAEIVLKSFVYGPTALSALLGFLISDGLKAPIEQETVLEASIEAVEYHETRSCTSCGCHFWFWFPTHDPSIVICANCDKEHPIQ